MRLAYRAVRPSLRGNGAISTACQSPASLIRATPRRSLPQSQWSPLSAPWSIHSSHFSSSAAYRNEATATMLKDDPTQSQVAEMDDKEHKILERDNTFASLKPHIAYPTFKALTVKPFGYTEMSEVQSSVLHLLPELADPSNAPMSDGQGGRDLLVKARTGTGKTLAFLVPAVERRVRAIHQTERGKFSESWEKLLKKNRPDFDFESLDKHGRTALWRQFATNTVGTLILSPTRELATQIANEAIKLHHFHEGYGVQLIVGGESRGKQLGDWRRSRPDVVVATPGRLKDLMTSEPMVAQACSATQTLILDEADTLLEMGFREEIKEIVDLLPPSSQRNTMLFSATVSKEIREITRHSLERNHRYIDCVPEGEDNVHQHIPQVATVLHNVGDQMTHIARLIALDQLQNAGKSKVIVFAPTTKMTQLLADIFESREIKNILPAGTGTHMYEIHSKKDQQQRFKTSDRFRKDHCGASVLFTSDLSARGVDYPGSTRVIQVGAPASTDQYIHRLGRTGRAGASGRGDIILLPTESAFLHFGLKDMPIKERSVEQIQEELHALSSQFDEDPTSVVDEEMWSQMNSSGKSAGKDRKGKFSKGASSSGGGLSAIIQPLQPRMEGIDEAVKEAVSQLDEEVVREVFFSLLGFYIGKFAELRTDKMTMVEGLKEWAKEAGGLPQQPFISQNMMEKLGIRGGGGFGRGGPSRGGFSSRGGSRGGFSRGGSSRGGFARGGGSFGDRRGSFRDDVDSPYSGGFSRGEEGGEFSGGRGGGGFSARGGGFSGGRGGRGGSFGGSREEGRFGDNREGRFSDSREGRFSSDRGGRGGYSSDRGGRTDRFSRNRGGPSVEFSNQDSY